MVVSCVDLASSEIHVAVAWEMRVLSEACACRRLAAPRASSFQVGRGLGLGLGVQGVVLPGEPGGSPLELIGVGPLLHGLPRRARG